MGHQKNKGTARNLSRPLSRRRGYIPEPFEVNAKPNDCMYVKDRELKDRNQHSRRDHKSSFNFTQTSCIMAIRNYVERMQDTKLRKKRNISSKDNAEKLIYSLKNDLEMISKYEEEAARNPGKQSTSDPFFVLSAMMCKINKLENLLLLQPDCSEQLARRKDMITMARCIKKSLLDQALCDKQLLQEKQRKIIGLVKSLDMFEKDIRCATRGIKRLCFPKSVELQLGSGSCACTDKERCAKECPGKYAGKVLSKTKSRSSSPVRFGEPCAVDTYRDSYKEQCLDPCKKYDITGLKVIYTKSHVQKDYYGGETEKVKDQVSCEVSETENCKVTVIKEGATTSSEQCNPIIKQKMTDLSKIWMESARQLIDACNTY